MKWTEKASPPSPRCAHTGNLLRSASGSSYLIFFGGWDGNQTLFGDAIIYDVELDTWIDVSQKGLSSIPRRFAHAATMTDDSKIIIYGGVNASDDLSDMVEISLVEPEPR